MLAKSLSFIAVSAAITSVRAHIGGYHKSMFCLNGLSNEDQQNNNEVANPLVNLTFDDFWFHGKCKDYPPAAGEFLDIPAGGEAVLELVGNRGQSSLSFEGLYSGVWPDGQDHSNYDNGTWDNTCIFEPNLHAENKTRAAGTALFIAYKSDIHDVQYEDLVAISVEANTPWHRITKYSIPADLPACPADGCICAYGWIPNHCGIPNEYMNGFRCKVSGAHADAPKVAKAQKAKWCENKPADCVSGAKGVTIFGQLSGNTINLAGIYQADTQEASPGYNDKMGFRAGAQLDIFEVAATTTSANPQPTSSSTAVPQPTESCSSISTRSLSGHRAHQRRLFSFAGFHLSMDAE